MALSFKDILAADVSNVFTNPDEFGESLAYRPKSGTARTINGVVDEEGDYQDSQYGRASEEVIDVFVLRDATTGIDDPQEGDSISRIIDGIGASAKSYSYSGQKIDTDESSWTLRFTRKIQSKHGGLPKA